MNYCIGIAQATTPAAPPRITTIGAGTLRISVDPKAAIPIHIVVVLNGLDTYAFRVSWNTEVMINPTAAEFKPGNALL